MADDEPKVYDDVPQTGAIVRTQNDARALAKKMAGEELPNECRFVCVTCGWDKTLQFEDDEIAALGHDVTSYGGPCPTCGSMTLTPHTRLMGEDVGNVYAHAKKQRLEEYREQADVLVDRVKEEVAAVVGGSLFDGPSQEPGPEDIHSPTGEMPEYPDAADVAPDLKPRG